MSKNKIIKLLSVIMCMSFITSHVPLVHSQGSDGSDLIITDIDISNKCFSSGDTFSIYVTVQNRGREKCPPGSVMISDITGGSISGAGNKIVKVQNVVLQQGESVTYQINGFKATMSSISFAAYCDYGNTYEETDETNNIFNAGITSQKSYADLSVNNIDIENESFRAGDNVNLSLEIINYGGIKIENSDIEYVCTVNGEEYTGTWNMSLKSGEKKIQTLDITADSEILDITINIPDTLSENNIENNTVSKQITSVRTLAYKWENAYLGPCGSVEEGIATDAGNIYIKTDVGGIYRFDREAGKYTPLTLSLDEKFAGSTTAFTVDEKDNNTIYLAAYTSSSLGEHGNKGESMLLRTKNGGDSWQEVCCPVRYTRDYIADKKMLAVDPNCSDVMFTGSFCDGLYKTDNATDDHIQWSKVTIPGYSADEENFNKISCITFDKTKLTSDGKTSDIYISVYNNGIYKSTNGGSVFRKMSGSPVNIVNIKVTSDGVIYAAANTKTESGALYKFENDVWTEISPQSGRDYRDVDVNTENENFIVTITDRVIYYSADAGDTWQRAFNALKETIFTHPWKKTISVENYFVIFDKTKTNKLWFGDWFGTYMTEDVLDTDEPWYQMCEGLEELCLQKLTAPPGENDFYVAGWDLGFLQSTDAMEYVSQKGAINNFMSGTTVDFVKKQPEIIVAAGGADRWQTGDGTGGYSLDGGKTLTAFESMPLLENGIGKEHFGNIAVAADKNENGIPAILAVPVASECLYRSDDFGSTWERVEVEVKKGIKTYAGTIILCSDTTDKDIFYYYNPETGKFFVSTDNGVTFNHTTTLPAAGSAVMRVFYQKEGYIVLALENYGLYLSKDYGQTFDKIEDVECAELVGTGKGTKYDTIFVKGKVNGNEGLFFSDNLGESFVKINNSQYNLSNIPMAVDGDKKQYGVVYVATNGHGVMVGKPDIITGTARFEGEDINPGSKYELAEQDGTVSVLGGGEGNSSLGTSQYIKVKYNAPIEGNYKFNVRFTSLYGKKIYAFINPGSDVSLNHDLAESQKQALGGIYVGYGPYTASSESMAMKQTSFTAGLKKGENTIVFEAHNKPFIDYVEITPPEYCIVSNGKVYSENRKIDGVESSNALSLMSARLLENNAVIGGIYKDERLIEVFFFDEAVTTNSAYEEVLLGNAEIAELDKTGYDIRIFVWENIGNITPVIK